MTREEAIKGLEGLSRNFGGYKPNEEMFNMAIEALKAEPCDTLKLDGMLEDAYEHGYQQARYDYEVQPCEDAVSRADTLQSFESYCENNCQYSKKQRDVMCGACMMGDAIEIVENLPPVTPKPTECEDVVSREHLLSEIDKLMQSPWFNSGKDSVNLLHYGYIERKEAVEVVRDLCVKTEPPVTPEQRTGHWEMPQLDDGMSDPIYYQVRCSECGFDLDPQTWHMELHQYGADKYCPNCGAKMEGESE